MIKLSRRSLARWAADQLLVGKSAKSVARHLAAVMVESGKPTDANFLLGDIAAELESRHELALSQVTTAAPLNVELRKALKAQIKKASMAHSVLLEENIDKSVIGGVRIETSTRVWDSTVSRKLADLKETF